MSDEQAKDRLTTIEIYHLREVIDWALGKNRLNGARQEMKELREALGTEDSKRGLIHDVSEIKHAIEDIKLKEARQRYIMIGAAAGIFIALIILAWQGNQEARRYLELLQQIRDTLP